MPSYTLRHTMDKVRYFRDLLTTDERKVQIIVGPTVAPVLQYALDDYKDVPVNQVCIIYPWDAKPVLAVKGLTRNKSPILIFVRWIEDPFIKELQDEYKDCDLVFFEPDPTLE